MKLVPLPNGTHALVDDRDLARVNARRWFVGTDGRPRTSINGIGVLMHRFILGVLPKFHVDHVNGNGLDNRRRNLRVCTAAENSWNRVRMNANNRSGLRGVHQDEHGRWVASIQHNKKVHRLGRFASAEEAARAYDAKAIELRGQIVTLNFPLE